MATLSDLETNLASRWEGVRPPPSFWEVPGLPRKFPELPRKLFGDFPRSSLTVELYSNPGVPRKFPRLPRKFPGLPRRFPGLPRRSALSLGSLTPLILVNPLQRQKSREPIKGWFRRRAVLANVPSWYRGASECTLVSLIVAREHPNVPLFRLWGSREHPPKPPFWKPPFYRRCA